MLTPHTAADWPLILAKADRPIPTMSARPSDAELERLAQHALSAGPFVTDDVKRVGMIVDRVQRANVAAALGGRRAVIVDGSFHHGKTHAVLVKALQQVRAARGTRSPHAVIPWVYVELSDNGQGRSLVESLLKFIGAPVPSRATTPQLTRVLRLLAPQIRLQGVVVDDLGSSARQGGGGDRAGGLATALKSLVMQVPATFVLVGTELEQTPMFSRDKPVAAAQQLIRRSTWVELGAWPAPQAKPGPWHHLVATLAKQIVLPSTQQFAIKNHAAVMTLHEVSEGRPGTAMEIVQNAADRAIRHRRNLDHLLIRAVSKELRGDRV